MSTKTNKSAAFSATVHPCWAQRLAENHWPAFEVKVKGRLVRSRGGLRCSKLDGSEQKEVLPKGSAAIRVERVVSTHREITRKLGRSAEFYASSNVKNELIGRTFRDVSREGQEPRFEVWL